jgi:capsular polysaccharide transport system permease protein
MASLRSAWKVQTRVIYSLLIRELITRFGRDNFGFLWMMIEPLMFASLVGAMWSLTRGTYEHDSISTAAFVATGYIPLTLFRHMVSRAVGVFKANSGLLFHKQIKVLDFIFARFIIEVIGSMMAFVFIGFILYEFGLMPFPDKPLYLFGGWSLYCLFVLSLTLVLAPLSEKSEIFEKLIPVVTYVMIPFSGAFTMNSWMSTKIRDYLIYSPFVNPMEMIRYGIFGDLVSPYYNAAVTFYYSLFLMMLGLIMCRRLRRTLEVE